MKHSKKRPVRSIVTDREEIKRRTIRTIALSVMAISIVYIGSTFMESARAVRTNSKLAAIYMEGLTNDNVKVVQMNEAANKIALDMNDEEYEPDIEYIEYKEAERVILPAMQAIYNENPDTVGWIAVPDTKINYPVVQTTDNEFYLSNNFYKEPSQPGTIFADHRAIINDYNALQSDVITLYGHKQYDNTMFGSLHNYHNSLKFYKENPTFAFSNLYDMYVYKIVSVFLCKTDDSWVGPDEEVFDFQNYISFDEQRSYEKFAYNILQRSEIITGVDIEPTDKFMMLSTCAYEYKGARFVVVGRRVRDGESSYVDTDVAVKNEYRLE